MFLFYLKMEFMEDSLIYYELPPVRCIGCNKPIGHLHESYQQLIEMNHSIEDVYECIGLVNYCCKKELTNCPRTNLVACKDYKMKDCPENHKMDTYKEVTEKLQIEQETPIPGVPLNLTTSKTVKVLSDVLYVNYIKHCSYLAQ